MRTVGLWLLLGLGVAVVALRAIGIDTEPPFVATGTASANRGLREVAKVAGGIAVGTPGTGLSRRGAAWRDSRGVRRRVKELNAARAEASDGRGTTISGVRLNRLQLVGIADEGVPMSVRYRFVFRSTVHDRRPDPDVWPAIESRLLPRLDEAAAYQCRQFSDDPAVDLRRC